MASIVWEIRKCRILLCGGSKITIKPNKFEIKPNSGHFEAFSPSQNQFFEKYLTFWKGHFYVNSKMPIFYEILTFFNFWPLESLKGTFWTRKFALKLKLDPPQSRNCHFLISQTMLVKIYWEFWVFYRFSRIKALTRMSISGYPFNLIECFNLGGI